MLVILKVHKHSRTGVGRWDQQGSVKHRLKSGADGSTPATASYVSVRPSVRTDIRFFIKLKATDWRSCGGWTANQRYRPVLCMHANTEILYLLKLLTVLAFFRVKSEDRDEQLSRSIRLKNLQTCIYFTWSPTNKTSTTSRSQPPERAVCGPGMRVCNARMNCICKRACSIHTIMCAESHR
jgi:hypothetical protein